MAQALTALKSAAANSVQFPGGELALARVIDRLGEQTGRLLRSVEAAGGVRANEIETPLRLALQLARRA